MPENMTMPLAAVWSNPQSFVRGGSVHNKMRRWQERHIEPPMQGVELDDWEDEIN